jgi:uncharacterized SAM-binding protein YcdF (DUF218 family)
MLNRHSRPPEGERVAASIDEHFVPDDIFPADLAIVFGISAWQRPVARAVKLYRDGLARKLVFTGGFNKTVQAFEAVEMARAAAAAGVPESDIIVEGRATNTVENVTNALACIDRAVGIGNVRSVLLVAIHFHMRRAKAISDLEFPPSVRIGCASYPSIHYSSSDWFHSARGRADVESETEKLIAYIRGRNGPQLR